MRSGENYTSGFTFVNVTRGLILNVDEDLFKTHPCLLANGARSFTDAKVFEVSELPLVSMY
jgi:hypothetical protein